MKKQKIEDIFSSMDNFSSVPPPELWDKIEEKLHQPKKKKATIIWWSIAASLLVSTFISSVLFDSALDKNIPFLNNNNVVLDEKKGLKDDKMISIDKKLNEENNDVIPGYTNELKYLKKNQKRTIQTADASPDSHEDSKLEQDKINSQKTSEGLNSPSAKRDATAISTHQSGSWKGNNPAFALQNITFGKKKLNSGSQNILFNSISENSIKPEERIAIANAADQNRKEENKSNPNFENIVIAKGSVQQKNNIVITDGMSKSDSLQLAELEDLEKKISPEDKIKKEKEHLNITNDGKWAVSVYAGVANSENYSNEKTLGYVNNSKQTNSFGVKTKYRLNKKWAVGSGVKINELGQSVANVSYMSLNNSAFFSTGDYYLAQNAPMSKIANSNNYIIVPNNAREMVKSENFQTGNLNQSLRYIEVPVEISYSVFSKKKASINLNTGGFVGKLISNQASIDGNTIGENINANDYVYGSTFSSTLQYRVYKKTNLFVEPAMNYYINPLQSQSFNNFQWGLNFGLNVSF